MGDPHVLLTIVPLGKVLHAAAYLTHACGTEAIASTRMLHGNGMVARKLQEGFPLLPLHKLLLAIATECYLGHGQNVDGTGRTL